MKKLFLPVIMLLCCFGIFLAYVGSSYGSLPPRVASHFGIDGRANGWMSRDQFVEVVLGFGFLMPAFVVGMMASVRWMPVRLVNLPNREYWLAPDRIRETAAVMLRFGLWLASLSVVLMTGLQYLVVRANTLYGGRRMDAPGTSLLLGGFTVGIVIWVILLKRNFRR